MIKSDNIYDKIRDMLGDVQDSLNILEEQDAKFACFSYTIHQLVHEFLIEEIQAFLQQYTDMAPEQGW